MSSASLYTNIILSLASGFALGWSLYISLSEVKKDDVIIKHANIFNSQKFNILSHTFFAFMVSIGARFCLHLVPLLQVLLKFLGLLNAGPRDEESKSWFTLRHLTSLGCLITIGIVNGIMRTPSSIHPCPLTNATVCDISEQKYDNDLQDTWFLSTLLLGICAILLKVTDVLFDFNFNLSEILEENRKGDKKTWTYLISVFLGLLLSTINLIISDIHDVKESEKYKDDSFLDWAVFLTMVALIAHSGLLLVTILSRAVSQFGDRLCKFKFNGVIAIGITVVMAIVSIAFLVWYLVSPNRILIPVFILSGILAIVFLLHLLLRRNKEVGIDFIAANEIPGLRMLVVLSVLSMLSIINGILVSYQIDATFASASLTLVALSDILGRNEF